jgi:hypothetical protein
VWNCRFESCLLGVYAYYTTVRINDVVMCNMTPYATNWYAAGGSGTIIPGAITNDCSGFPAPFIFTQPVGGAVNAGSSKTFTVVAEGKCLLYQWYSYSDMTGFVTLGSTFSSGSWVFVHDEGVSRAWHLLSWNGYTPTYTWINVDVRAANLVTDLPNLPFKSVVNGQPIVGVSGRCLEVRVTLHRQALNAATPRLEALTVHAP